MGLQTLVEIVRADACNHDGDQHKQDGQDGETRQTLPGRLVILEASGIGGIHSDELEEEIAERDEVDEDDDDHARNGLAADPVGGQEKENEGDGQRGGRQRKLGGGGILDDDKELHGEGEEEEEIELEKSNVNLSQRLAMGKAAQGRL